jgi:subtilase family serine protease
LEDPCYSPQQIQVAYGIQPLLERGIDGRGETVTAVVPVPVPSQGPSDIRQDLAAFDSMFHLPAARIEVVTSLVPSASRWQATGEELGDLEAVHAVAPAATLRVVLFPASWDNSPANATADMLAALLLVVSHTDVASISWGLGAHYFTPAQVAKMHSILLGAEAHHVTVVASSGDDGVYPTPRGWGGRQVEEVSLPVSDPLVLGGGGTQLSANPKTGAYIGETAWSDSGGGFSHLYVRPAYQDGVPGISKSRGVPDVAADADAPGGLAQVYTSKGTAYLVSESARAVPRRSGRESWRWPTSTPIKTSASSTPPSTTSAAAPATTRPFTTLRPASTVTRRLPDGTR